jgi:hypothetical protein
MTLHSSQMMRGGYRDDRRRRLLAEDLTANAGLPASEIPAIMSGDDFPHTHKSENYGDAEFLQSQLRLTDLVPRRLIAYFLLLAVGLAAIGGLLALRLWLPDLLRAPDIRLTIADVGSPGSLGNWFASLLLLAASLLTVVIYTVRRHKVDDYRGHYRIWLWAAACWFLMATDAAASLHQGLQQIMISITGTQIVGDGSVWWLAPLILVLGTIGSRLVIDMRSSRLSTGALVFAAISYLTALTATFHGIVLQTETAQLLFVEGAFLAGHLLIAISMGLHARYVLLDAEGSLPKRAMKKKADKKVAKKTAAPKKAKPADQVTTDDSIEKGSSGNDTNATAQTQENGNDPRDDADDTWVAIDPPHGTSTQPVLKRVASSAASALPSIEQKLSVPAGESSSSDSDAASGKLSKADRKALKKKLLDERLKRERKAEKW